MKKLSISRVSYLFLMTFFVLLIGGILYIAQTLQPAPQQAPLTNTQPENPANPLATYQNNQYHFLFQYPSDFDFYETQKNKSAISASSYIPACDPDTSIACALYSQAKHYPHTNFDSAGMSVNLIKDAENEMACFSFTDRGYVNQQVTTKVLNGETFMYAELGDAGAGHFASDHAYRIFKNSTCLEINLRVASTNFANYDPGLGVKEFTKADEALVWQKLESVLGTFKLTE